MGRRQGDLIKNSIGIKRPDTCLLESGANVLDSETV